MAGVEVDLVELLLGAEVDAARGHEAHRPLDLAGDGVVAPALAAADHELPVPHVDLAEVGKAALGERPQQVQCGRCLVVRLHHPLGVGHPRLGREPRVVDHMAPEGGDLTVADSLDG